MAKEEKGSKDFVENDNQEDIEVKYIFRYASISISYSLLCNDTLGNNSCKPIRVKFSYTPIRVLFSSNNSLSAYHISFFLSIHLFYSSLYLSL